jgi:hypothetical protein
MQRVPIDVWLHYILPALTPLEYVVLRNVLPLFIRHPNRFLSSAAFCHAALRKVLRHQEVCNELATGTLMLTGGYLLNVLNGWNGVGTQDLDICVVEAVVNWNALVAQWIPREEHYGHGDYDGVTVIKYRLPYPDDRELDLIVFDSARLMRQYLHKFDLSFCANSLSGDRLVICDLEAVIKRKAQLWTSFYLHGRLASALTMEALRTIYEKADRRVAKYRLRGYTICVKQDHERIPEVLCFDPDYFDEATQVYLFSYGAEHGALRQHQAACERIKRLWSFWWK